MSFGWRRHRLDEQDVRPEWLFPARESPQAPRHISRLLSNAAILVGVGCQPYFRCYN